MLKTITYYTWSYNNLKYNLGEYHQTTLTVERQLNILFKRRLVNFKKQDQPETHSLNVSYTPDKKGQIHISSKPSESLYLESNYEPYQV